MVSKPKRRYFALLIAVMLIFSVVAVQGQPEKTISDSRQTVKAKREIIKLLLNEIFRGEQQESVRLSQKNMPPAILRDFPKFENLAVQLVAPASEGGPECPFEFSIFEVSGDAALVLFGDCRDGLGYNFEKVGGKWQFAPLAIERQ